MLQIQTKRTFGGLCRLAKEEFLKIVWKNLYEIWNGVVLIQFVQK